MAEKSLNLESLHQYKDFELENAIKLIEKEQTKRLKNEKIRRKLEKLANEIGMTLQPLDLSQAPGAEQKPQEVYQHPTDKNLTWTATRGRKPNWLKLALKEGRTLQDLRVPSQ